MSQALRVLKREAVLVGAAALGAVELALSSGNTLQVALQAAVPVALGALIRTVQSTPTTKEDHMADLTALRQAVADLESAAQTVSNTVTAIKNQATPQSDVDAVTTQVQQAAATLHGITA